MSQKVYFVGSHAEVAHHAAPLCAEFVYEIASPEETLRHANAGDLAIFYSEHFDRFRDCVHQLKQRRVATLYMIDGILEWRNAWENRVDEVACPWTMRPAMADKVACIGYSQIATLNSWGNTAKTELVGIPRFDRLRQLESTPLLPNPNRARILLMSAKCPGFTPEQIQQNFEGFDRLKAWFAQNPIVAGREIELVWRMTGELSDRLDVPNQCDDLTGSELVDVINSVDAVISTPSTAILEAMLLQRPVATIDFNHSPQWAPTSWCINSETQINSVVNELLDVPPAKQQYQQTALDMTLAPTTNASRRFGLLVKRMLECSASVGENDLEFPTNLLADQLLQVETNFEHAQLYPSFSEFQNSDLLELQTHLAHSRREIQHLHREMDQLKSELNEAHEIFDQIHRHPVAGPIVRIRQKLISWLNRTRQSSPKSDRPVSSSSSPTSTESTATF